MVKRKAGFWAGGSSLIWSYCSVLGSVISNIVKCFHTVCVIVFVDHKISFFNSKFGFVIERNNIIFVIMLLYHI